MYIAGFLFIIVFALAMIAGRILPPSVGKAADKLLMPTVLALIFTISMWGGGELTSLSKVTRLVAYSLAYSIAIVLVTYAVGMLISRGWGRGRAVARGRAPLVFILTLVVGWVVGAFTRIPIVSNAVEPELMVLASVVGLSTGRVITLRSIAAGGRVGLMASLAALIGSSLTGLALSRLLGVGLNVSLAVALGMGWYTFTGPTVALYAGPYYGLLAFLTNFLREQLTYVVVPFMPGSPEALISVGGATTMDDTLPVYVSVLGRDYSVASISNGLLLTVVVPIVVPLVLTI